VTDRRFIEESFPVKEVSAISAREKNIRHGHISTLHIWWARRPLAEVLAPDPKGFQNPSGLSVPTGRSGPAREAGTVDAGVGDGPGAG
jgi:hypothetical protein